MFISLFNHAVKGGSERLANFIKVTTVAEFPGHGSHTFNVTVVDEAVENAFNFFGDLFLAVGNVVFGDDGAFSLGGIVGFGDDFGQGGFASGLIVANAVIASGADDHLFVFSLVDDIAIVVALGGSSNAVMEVASIGGVVTGNGFFVGIESEEILEILGGEGFHLFVFS